MNTPSIIKVGTTLTVILGGKVYTVDHTVKNYTLILNAVKGQDWEELQNQLDIAQNLAKKSNGRAEIVDGVVCLDGIPVQNVIADRILSMVEEGFTVDPMLRFLENVNKNPADYAIQELYLFLETNRLPITEDGCFLAYKVVRDDYMDCHSGTIRNQIGDTPSMKREDVDPVRDRTCSRGLHFCSLNYIRAFAGHDSRLMIVKVNPADVVSIPSDYGNTKGRCWRYEVVDEIALERRAEYDSEAPAVVNLKTEAEVEREGIRDFIADSVYFLGGPGEVEFTETIGDVLDEEDTFDLIQGLEDEYSIEITVRDPESGQDIDVAPYQGMTFEALVVMVQSLIRAEKRFTTNLIEVEAENEDGNDEEADPLVTLINEFGLKGQEVNGPTLRGVRERYDITRLALAEEMGVARGSIWSYEESLTTKPETAEKYLRALLALI